MKLYWRAKMIGEDIFFDASVPGNIQDDYAKYNNWGDINYADNCKKYLELEDAEWIYETNFSIEHALDEAVYFVSKGIDYEYDIFLNGEKIHYGKGLYSPIEINITDKIITENVLTVRIYKHPKRAGAPISRSQADNSAKPPVGYGWDWHPRVIPSGMWEEAYIEVRKNDYISDVEINYALNNDFSKVDVEFSFDTNGKYFINIFTPEKIQAYR